MSSTGGRHNQVPLIVAAVVAIGAILALVWFVVGRPADAPEESAAPATEAASQPSPEPTPTPTLTPEAVPSAYALTVAGDLVELDPTSGAVIRTVSSNPYWHDSLVITPDRTSAYVDAIDNVSADGPEWPGEIQRVSLTDGPVEIETVVLAATSPAVSPDGAALAYLAIAPGEVQSSVRSLTFLDLSTGDVTAAVPDDQCVECERWVTHPAWTPDSSEVVLGLGWVDGFPGIALHAVDPGTTTLDAGSIVGPDNSGDLMGDWSGTTAFADDGSLLVPAEEGTAAQWEARAAFAFGDGPNENQPTSLVAIVDVATGDVVQRVPVDGKAIAVAAQPSGPGFLVLVAHPETEDDNPSLYRWDGSALTLLGEGYSAIAW